MFQVDAYDGPTGLCDIGSTLVGTAHPWPVTWGSSMPSTRSITRCR